MKLDGRLSFATIQKLCVLYLMLWAMVPPFMVDNVYRYIGLGACAVWFVLALLRGMRLERIHIYALAVVLLVILISYINTGTFDGVIKKIAIYLLVICFIMKDFYNDKQDELRWILPIILLLYIFFNIKSYSAFVSDSTVARLIVRNDVNTYSYIRQGVGGYGYLYPQVCIFPALLAWIIKSRKKNIVLCYIGIAWLVTYCLVISKANYSIAIFATLMSAFVLLCYKGKSIMAVVLISFMLFIGAMLLILYVDWFRNDLLEFFDGTAVAKKINDLVSTSESGETEGSIASRTTRYFGSIEAILRHPIFGGLLLSDGGGWGHSAILDVYADFGIFAVFVYVKAVFCNTTYYSYCESGIMRRIVNAITSTFIFILFLNSAPYQFMPIIIVLLAVILSQIEDWVIEDENIMDGKFDSSKRYKLLKNR